MKKMLLGLQVYTIRDDAEKDFPGAMAKVRRMGYDGVELAGLYGHTPREIGAAIQNAGLRPISAHVPYAELLDDTDGTIGRYVEIGCSYLAVPYLTEEYRPGAGRFEEVVENIRRIGQVCAEKGVSLLYHNHDFEFARMPDGRYALDVLYDSVPAAVLQTELDTCWIRVCGEDPAAYIRKYTGRSPLVHLKDYAGAKSANMYQLIGIQGADDTPSTGFGFRPLGGGVQDFTAILRAAEDAGAEWLIAEQDEHPTGAAMEDARISADFLRKLQER